MAFLNSFQDIVINYTSSGIREYLHSLNGGDRKASKNQFLLPEQQDSMKVLTIHKSKGLEFGIVILPFLSWNLDHKAFHSNILWAVPGSPPFNKLGIVPVRYKK